MRVSFREGVEVIGFQNKSRNKRLVATVPAKPLPSLSITQEALQKALGIDAPIVAAKAYGKNVTFSVMPRELWPDCPECGTPFFPKWRSGFCSRNCCRRARYRAQRERVEAAEAETQRLADSWQTEYEARIAAESEVARLHDTARNAEAS